jgi:hypothetical protein
VSSHHHSLTESFGELRKVRESTDFLGSIMQGVDNKIKKNKKKSEALQL